jgi:hypothetical protein
MSAKVRVSRTTTRSMATEEQSESQDLIDIENGTEQAAQDADGPEEQTEILSSVASQESPAFAHE